MRKLALTLCILGTGFAVSACESTSDTGYVDTQPPYEQGRTAGYEDETVMKAKPRQERVFREYQSK